jgi:uncharacterized protein (TIGR03437 family)
MDVCRLGTACLLAVFAGRLFSQVPAIGFDENLGQFPKEILYASRAGASVTSTAFFVRGQTSLQFENATPGLQPRPLNPLPGVVNAIGGGVTVMGARQYAGVQLAGVYPGVDAALVVRAPALLLRFNLAAGASIGPLRIKVSGINSLSVEDRGSLDAEGGYLLLGPSALQGQTSVRVRFTLIDSTRFTFLLDPYDNSQPLTIETRIATSNIYLPAVETVTTPSGAYYVLTNAPKQVGGTCQANSYCQDAAVFKFNAAGAQQYVTYLSGSGDQEVKRGAARQRAASSGPSPGDLVCLTGSTTSPDFPVTPNAAQKANAGNGDVFVAALDGNTGGLIYATFLGGPNEDRAYYLRLDAGNGVHVVGSSNGALPVTRTLFPPGGCSTSTSSAVSFAAAIDISTGELRYLTYLPGCASAMDVDPSGNLYFTGFTYSSFPVTKGAYLTQTPGSISAFVARLNADGTALDFGTYLGESGFSGRDIAVDSHGSVWLTLESFFAPSFFLAKLESAGSKLAYYSPFFLGDILVDGSDNLVFFSSTLNGPTSLATQSGLLRASCAPNNLFKLDLAGALLLERGLPGSPLGFDNQGNLLVGTATGVTAIGLTANPRGWAACLYNSASWDRQNQVAPGEIVSIMGAGLGPAQGSPFRADAQGRVPTATGGTRVLFNGVPGPVLYAQEGQVNAIVPFGISPGSSLAVQVEYQGQALPSLTVPVCAAQPGFFTMDGSGSGRAVAVNQDGTINSEANPAFGGSAVSVFVNGLGATSPASVEGVMASSTAPKPTAAYGAGLFGQVINGDAVYVGPSPGSLSSVIQINLRVPSVQASPIPASSTLHAALTILPAGENYISQSVWVAVRSQP